MWISILHVNESCHTHGWVVLFFFSLGVTIEWVIPHMNVSCHDRMSHGTHMNELWHTHEWVMAHTWMRNVTQMNEWRGCWQRHRHTHRHRAICKPAFYLVCKYCNTLQHTAVCNTLQHTATHCNTLQHTQTHCNTLQHTATRRNTLQHTATHCNTLQHTATHCNTLQHAAILYTTLHHTTIHCNTLPALNKEAIPASQRFFLRLAWIYV